MSVVCLLLSHANCDILYVYLYACSVYLCLLACCVLRALLFEIKWMMMMIMMMTNISFRLLVKEFLQEAQLSPRDRAMRRVN